MNEDFSEQTPIAAPAPSYSSEEYKSALKLLEIGDLRELQKCINLMSSASEDMHKEKGYFSVFERDKYLKALKHKLNQLYLKAIEEELEEKQKEFSVLMDAQGLLTVNHDYDGAIQHCYDTIKQLEAAYNTHHIEYKADGSCLVHEVKMVDVVATLHDRKELAEIQLNALCRIRDRKAAELKLEEENNDKET